MSTKNKLIEQANKRLNESLPPMINFTEFEVHTMLDEIIKANPELQEEIMRLFQSKLVEKGRNLNPGTPPPGAFH